VVARICRSDLIVIDDIGSAPRGAVLPGGLRGPLLTATAVRRS
jgi:hypothetical protein